MKIYVVVKDRYYIYTNDDKFETWSNGENKVKLFSSHTEAEDKTRGFRGVSIREVEIIDEMWLNFGDAWEYTRNDYFIMDEYAIDSFYFLSKQKLEDDAFIPCEGLYAEDKSGKYYYFKPKGKTIVDYLKETFKTVEAESALEYIVSLDKMRGILITITDDGMDVSTQGLKEELFEPVRKAFNL